MSAWFAHLAASPYCHAHYAVGCNAKGQGVCQCGWVGSTSLLAPPISRGVRFSDLGRSKADISYLEDEEDDNVDAWATIPPAYF